MRRSMLETLADIVLYDSIRPLKLMTLPLLVMGGLGFLIQSATDPDAELGFMLHLMPAVCWVSLFALVTICRFVGVFIWEGSRLTMIGVPSIAILLWSFIFASGAIMSRFDGMELLYLVPATIEAWILSRQIGEVDGL